MNHVVHLVLTLFIHSCYVCILETETRIFNICRYTGLAKSLARRPGAIAFSSRATKMYHRPARRATLNTAQGVFKALKCFKCVKWYKKSLNCNFKRSYSWGWKGKNRDMAGLNFKRQWCHWINMSAARFKVKTTARMSLWMYLWREPTVLRNVSLAFSFNLAYKMPDKAAFISPVLLCLQPLPGERTSFILAAALKAPPRGREWICISKKPILCLDRPMFLRSKHRVVNVKS